MQPTEYRMNSKDDQLTAGSRGPAVCAVVAAGIGGAMLVALVAGLPIRINVVLAVLVPGAATAAGLIAMAMGWIFLSYGRHHRRPAAMSTAVVGMGLAIVELLALIFVMIHAGSGIGYGG